MSKLKVLALACTIVMSAGSASAQFTTGGGKSKASAAAAEIGDYNQFGISYVNEKFSYDFPKGSETEDISANGFALKYIHGFSVSKSLPMYVETGLNVNFNFASTELGEDPYTYTQKFQNAALAIPINFAYKFNINENVAIKPFLGLNVKLNLLGRTKMEFDDEDDNDGDYDYDFDYDDDYDYYYSSREYVDDDFDYGYGNSDSDKPKWSSLYSKKDMGGKNSVWNRFQLGWHVGVDFQFNKFFLGVNYGTDFIKAFSYKKYKVNSSTLNVSLGVCF